MNGGNITDITHEEALKLLSDYYKTLKPTVSPEYIFVGNVHGDMNQFILPLIDSGIITVNGVKYGDDDIYPEARMVNLDYTINNSSTIVIYLGDMINEYMFSRQIIQILKDLLIKTSNVKFIYGNHDCSLIGRYDLFTSDLLNISEDIPTLWTTLKNELRGYPNIRIIGDKITYKNNPEDGQKFLKSYLTPLFSDLFHIFSNNLGRVCISTIVNDEPFMLSHTTWTKKALSDILLTVKPYGSRPGDHLKQQLDKITSHIPSPKSIEIIKNYSQNTDYNTLSDAVNDVFRSQSKLYISKNGLTYTRNIENIFLNHIVGHSVGHSHRDINVNIEPSSSKSERKMKLKPTIINDKKIYYFDFGCSAGYEHDEISKPDYVMVKDKTLSLSILPEFSFELKSGKYVLNV